jgi:plastocyanin
LLRPTPADNYGMHRIYAAAIAIALTALTLRAAAPESSDLHGTARAGTNRAPNVVVWLDAPNLPGTAAGRTVVLDQRNLAFSPDVLAVRVGTTIDLPNNDRVFHNVFSFRDGKVFDLGMYPVGASRQVTFDRPGLSRIFCNIHPGMAAYVMAVDSPFFAVSDQSGAFRIAEVPLGTHQYRAWRAGAPQLAGRWSGGPLTIAWP